MKLFRSHTSSLWAAVLAYVALSVVLPATSYVLVQQDLRLSAYDPQIQLAEDAALATAGSTQPSAAVGSTPVEAAASLAPFVTIYDADMKPLASSGQFNGATLAPPTGSFDSAKAHAINKFTWVPAAGGRYAAVLVYRGDTKPGYVLAARSMFEVESRIERIGVIALSATASLLVFGAFLLLFINQRRP